MNINSHIRFLLLHKDEVILHNLGVLKTVFHPATCDRRRKMVSPPRKTIEFIFDEATREESFAEFIAEKENIEFEAAQRKVSDFISKIRRELNRGQKVYLTQIGMLMVRNKEIIFEFDDTQNFLLQSTGMLPVKSIPIRKDKIAYLSSFFLLILIFILIIILLNPMNLDVFRMKSSGMIPLLEYKEDKSDNIEKKNYDQLEVQADKNSDQKAEQTTNQSVDQETKTQIDTITLGYIEGIETHAKPADPTKQYHIIVASYNSLIVAQTNLEKWQDMGHHTLILGPSDKGYYRISIGQYNTEQKANEDLKYVNKWIEPTAWIFFY